MSKRKSTKRLASFCLILCLVVLIVFGGLQILESTFFNREQPEEKMESKTVVRGGVEYFPRQDITVLLIMGIDQYGPAVDSGFHVNDGSCDMISLMIFDEVEQTYSILSLNRDTMVDVPVLGIGGRPAGTEYTQLATAHNSGSGLEDSCELVRTAVTNLLPGIRIDYYMSLRMDSIVVLNDAVGGVTVNIEDDFTHIDPDMTKGPYTLHGRQAITYTRSRRDVGDHLNVSRMRRQEEYMRNFAAAFRARAEESEAFVISAYDELSPYLVTDCSATVLTSMMQHYSGYKLTETVTPEGENVLGDVYYEFYVDEEKLDDLVLRLFYAPKK